MNWCALFAHLFCWFNIIPLPLYIYCYQIMDIENVKKIIERKPNLSTALGMNFISTPEQDTCKAGGASLALAENLAGVGSCSICPDKICVGISVSGEHVRAVQEGDTVTANARLVSKGHKLHVWEVSIVNSHGELISTVHVTNYVLTPKDSQD